MKHFHGLVVVLLLAIAGLVSAIPPEVEANEVTRYLWNQASNGVFIPYLHESGEMGQVWNSFLNTQGENIVKQFYDARYYGDATAIQNGKTRFMKAVTHVDKRPYKFGQNGRNVRIAMAQELVGTFAKRQHEKQLKDWGRTLSIGRGESSTGQL
ncbi:uncharacterized protein SRS1_25068 [Sporisorium reilianum f. sp. reilianum]|uniref:Uncharacterized protein n=1 Tax=Sporisorium reilianum f. sp. reilianum TaxID=72559 RepID=A0A2N8UDC7_9BASI|nr:uncharacterized protein SRS1_25068 [Sporisorium reilianum f. sp. reilianum]